MPEIDSTNTEATAATEHESETDESQVDWKAKAREWEAKSKANHKRIQELEPKASQFDALEAASKSELEREREQTKTLSEQLATTQREALIASVALDKGLPGNLARRLQGESREDLEADADELLTQFQASGTNSSRPPAPDPSQGSSAQRSAAGPEQDFANFIGRQLAG